MLPIVITYEIEAILLGIAFINALGFEKYKVITFHSTITFPFNCYCLHKIQFSEIV